MPKKIFKDLFLQHTTHLCTLHLSVTASVLNEAEGSSVRERSHYLLCLIILRIHLFPCRAQSQFMARHKKTDLNPHTNIEKKTNIFEYVGSARTPKAYWYTVPTKWSGAHRLTCVQLLKFCGVRTDPAYSYEG